MKAFRRGVAVTLGYGLVFLGGSKLNGIPQASAPLAAIRIPAELWGAVGGGELLIGLLLTQPAVHRMAGTALTTWLLAATALHVLAGDVPGALVPLVLAGFGLWIARDAARFDARRAWPAPLARLPETAPTRFGFVARHLGVSFLLRWAVGGVVFWAALPLLALSHARKVGAASTRARLELVLLHLLFYGYGAGGIWNFSGHFFAADMVAASVGWPAGSPFQQELAFYALGTGTVGLLTPWLRDRFWIAAALAPSIFVYGAAFTHIQDYLIAGNEAPMNWSFTAVGANLLIPTVVLALTWIYWRRGGFEQSLAPASTADTHATQR